MRGLPQLGLLVLAGAVLAPGTAAADEPPSPKRAENFWQRTVAPYAEEVAAVIHKASSNLDNARVSGAGLDIRPSPEVRQELLDDAVGMLRFARRLDPDNLEVLRLFARAAYESGRATEARDAIAQYLGDAMPDDVRADTHILAGRIYAAAGDYEDAAIHFRLGVAKGVATTRPLAAVYLADLFVHTGQMGEAIAVLREAGDPRYVSQLVPFALAVAYDKDEQLTRSYDTLKGLQTTEQSVIAGVALQIQALDFVDPLDRYYYSAFMYEVAGHLPEARAEWLAYARAGERARFRRRALAHIDEIDELLDETRTAPVPQPAAVPQPPHHYHGGHIP